MLNKDHDICYFLAAAEAEMADNSTSMALNLATYLQGGSIIQPSNLVDIFKAIVPRLAVLNRRVTTNFGATPQYILTGLRTSAILESIQRVAVGFNTTNQGDYGFSGDAAAFAKQTILYSPAMSDNKIYTIYKAPSDNLSRSVLIDLVYKPLYIIEEITNSLKRTFVKSRTAIEFCDARACGVINVSGTTNLLGE